MLVLFLHCQDGGTAGNFRAVVDSPQASFSVRGRKERKKANRRRGRANTCHIDTCTSVDNARQPTQTLTDTNDPEPDAGEGESLAHAAAAHAAPPERAHHVVHGAWGACAARASWLGVRVCLHSGEGSGSGLRNTARARDYD